MGGRGGRARLMDLRHVAFSRSSSSCGSSPHRRRCLLCVLSAGSCADNCHPAVPRAPAYGRPGGRGSAHGPSVCRVSSVIVLVQVVAAPPSLRSCLLVAVVAVPSPRRDASSPAVALLPVQAVRCVCVHVMAYAHVVPRSVPNDTTAGQAGPSRAAGRCSPVAATVPGTAGLAWLPRFAGGASRSFGHGSGRSPRGSLGTPCTHPS